MNQIRLINAKVNQENYDQQALFRNHVLEQYKLYVEMADKISLRRQQTNTFFISLNTLVLSIFGAICALNVFKLSKTWLILTGVLGILLATTWWLIILSYRQLNTGKFKIINEMEGLLPIKPYQIEWVELKEGKDIRVYFSISHVEQIVPILVAAVYVWVFLTGIYMH